LSVKTKRAAKSRFNRKLSSKYGCHLDYPKKLNLAEHAAFSQFGLPALESSCESDAFT